jgi:hypothetical protein
MEQEAQVQDTYLNENTYEAWLFGAEDESVELCDEYEIYCNCNVEKSIKTGLEAIIWWSELRQRQLYPHLHRMALDILSIPAISAEPERLFSETKKIITAERHSLLPATIEAIEGIKSFNQ